MKYNIAKQLCLKEKIKSRDDYRAFRKNNIMAYNQLPATPENYDDWKKEWVDWNEFLRNPYLVPEKAILIENNYYRYEDGIWHNCSKGFIELTKRLHSNGNYICDIRSIEGKKKSVYINPEKINFNKYWLGFQKSSDYQNAIQAMIKSGLRFPYIDNILYISFMAGFNSNKK